MKTVAISFSYADNSLQTRGLKLLQEKLDMQIFDMLDFNMPVCNSNKSDGVVPDSVEKFNKVLESADVLIFAISEATSHYCAGFKNAMDWLVVKSVFNASLGTNYSITDKPIFVVTFSPTTKYPNGARHFDMTTELLEKLGADVKECHIINNSWKTVIPGGFNAVKSVYSAVEAFLRTYTPPSTKTPLYDANNAKQWLKQYHDWDRAWRYDIKEVKRVNGMPWPRLPENIEVDVPLKQDYKMRSMDYLDTPEARPIFEKQAEYIIKHNIKNIVDIGCRIGIINDILQEKGYTDYQYMGFDTSPEPIEYAKEIWQSYSNIEYRCASMYNKEDISVDFDVDCVIWSGVLLYDPENHMQLFDDLTVYFYCADYAIIQEPCAEQDPNKFLPKMKLQTIEQELHQYKNLYSYYEDCVIDADIFAGKRRIAFICI